MATGLFGEWMNTARRVRAEEHDYAAEVRRLAEEIARRSGAAPDWRRCMWVCRAFLAAEENLDWDRAQAVARAVS
jgi:hypothetical protein